MHELNKKEKALSRELIERGLQKECADFLNRAIRLASKADGKTPHEKYLALYKRVHSFDKHLGARYGKITGGHYLTIVTSLFLDGIISEEDIAGYREENRNSILNWKKIYDSEIESSDD